MVRQLLGNLANIMARRKLGKRISVGHDSQIHCRLISMRQNCTVKVGENSLIEGGIAFDKEEAAVLIGNRTFVGGGTRLVCAEQIILGDDVLIAWGCTIVDHNSHSLQWPERQNDVLLWLKGKKDWSVVKRSPVNIENKVWIGFNTIILKGVTVGTGAVVGAGSVVTQNVPEYTIVAGNPARVVRKLNAEGVAEYDKNRKLSL